MKYLMRFPDGKAKAVTLSYDDGVAQDIRLIEIMNRYGLKGTFNLNSGALAKTDAIGGKGRMSEKQVLELYSNSGNEVAIHGYTHPFLDELDTPLICQEILKDRQELERVFGGIIRGMAYPFGTYNDDVIEALRLCGIAYARTSESTEGFNLPKDWLKLPATCAHSNPRLFNLTKSFAEKDSATIGQCWLFYLWGHSYEFDNDNNWDVIEEFGEIIGKREDIWYATNIEICDYVNAFKKLQFNVIHTLVYNPTVIDVWILKNRKNIKIAAGEYVKLD